MTAKKKKPSPKARTRRGIVRSTKTTGIIRGQFIDEPFDSLSRACQVRNKEFRTPDNIPGLFWSSEIGGEAGEAAEALLNMLQLLAKVGKAVNTVKKLERERMGMAGSRTDTKELARELSDVVISAVHNANHFGIDLQAAIHDTFNATSDKLNMKTHLSPGWSLNGLDPMCKEIVENMQKRLWSRCAP